jgi:hypothetical protein
MADKIMPHRPKENADPPDPKEGGQRVRGRRWAFVGVVGISILAAIFVAVWAPFTATEDNAQVWPVLVPPVVAAMMVGGLGWLAVYVLVPPKGAKRD